MDMKSCQIASNRTPRRINRNLLFNMIRTQKSISRADLARLSGLQFSTVSVIVEDLIADGWIVEGSCGLATRGRRPTFLEIDKRRVVVGLDVHPAQMIVGISDLAGNLIAQHAIALPKEPDRALSALVSGTRKVLTEHKDKLFAGVGVCLPGRTDLNLQELRFAPNLQWTHSKLKSRMERGLGLKVVMDNVANACALAEVWFGGIDREHDIVVVNVSEGLGTGIYANGRLLRGDSGMAGEFGHVILDPTGIACSCGRHGCWETLASNRAALRYYDELVPQRRIRSFDRLVQLAELQDAAAVSALNRMSVELGRGLKMIASILDPREIVAVGPITSAWTTFGPIIEAEMRRNSSAATPALRPSYDGANARLRGAVALILNDGQI